MSGAMLRVEKVTSHTPFLIRKNLPMNKKSKNLASDY